MGSEPITLRGELKGHEGWVTCLCTTPHNPDALISGSRGAHAAATAAARRHAEFVSGAQRAGEGGGAARLCACDSARRCCSVPAALWHPLLAAS